MTGTAPISVEAQWALYGKRLDRQGYRVLACSSGVLGPRNFEELISRFSPGTLGTLPQVTLSYLTPGPQPGEGLLAMAIHRTGEGEEQLKYDDDGRRIVVTNYFCVPYHPLGPARVSYQALYRAALAALPLPQQDGPPITFEIADRTGITPAVDDLSMRAAALLLTCQPVCLLGAEDTTADERLAFIDTVMSLLPYGLRAKMTAATWTRPTNRDHKIRLFFSDAMRATDADHALHWGQPEATAALTETDDVPYEYLNWLKEKVSQPTAELAGLTDPLGFGRDGILRTLENIHGKSHNPTAGYSASGRDRPSPEPLPQIESGNGRGFGEQVLRACAAHLRDGSQRHLVRSDIDKLRQMANSPASEDRARYREIIKQTRLLRHAERCGEDAVSLCVQLIRVAFRLPFGYDDYCQLEDCLEGQPLPLALLMAIHSVEVDDPVVKAIVYRQLQQIDVDGRNWYISPKKADDELSRLIGLLAAPSKRRDHARIVWDFTLDCLETTRPHPEPLRNALRQTGFLASALQASDVGSEQYQVDALLRFLKAAYPQGLDRPAIMQVLTGNGRPPTAPLVAAVLLLAEPADIELAGDMYARGSIMSAEFVSETQIRLGAKIPAPTSETARR